MIKEPKFYAVLDLETLGLNPQIHQTIEIGAVLLDANTRAEVSSYHAFIRPEPPVLYEAQALKITGVSLHRLAQEGMPPRCAWSGLCKWLNDEVNDTFDIQLVFMNKVFDAPRIENELIKYGLPQPWNYGYKWDIMDMARFLSLDVDKISLFALCEYFGISNEGAHGALADARMTAEVFRRFEAIRDRIKDIMNLETMQKYMNKVRGLS